MKTMLYLPAAWFNDLVEEKTGRQSDSEVVKIFSETSLVACGDLNK